MLVEIDFSVFFSLKLEIEYNLQPPICRSNILFEKF